MTAYPRKPILKRFLAGIALASLAAVTLFSSPLTALAGVNPVKSSIIITSSHGGIDQSTANPLQVVRATIYFDQAISVSSAADLRSELDVNINGNNVPALGDTSPDPYMVFDIETLGSNYITLKVFTPSPAPGSGMFAIMGADMSITSTSTVTGLGKILSSVTAAGSSNVALWPDTAFSHQVIATGLGFGAGVSTSGDNSTSTPPSLVIPISSLPQVRGVSYVQLGQVDAYGSTTPIPATYDSSGLAFSWPSAVTSLNGTIPLHSHMFYTLTANSYALLIKGAVEYPSNYTGYEVDVSGDTLTITKTAAYADDETISLKVINYTNQ